MTPANPTIAKGNSQQFTATGTYSDGTTADLTTSVIWWSANTNVAPITTGGSAMGNAKGHAKISAAFGPVTGSTTLTVAAPALTALTVTPANPTIAKGNSQQFTATGTYSDGTNRSLTASVTWASSDPAATITTAGLATAVAVGTSTITATQGPVSASTTLIVTAPALTAITVTPANPTIAKGSSQQFTATGTYSDGSTADLTTSVIWWSSNTNVAPITTGGSATGNARGHAKISAAYGPVTGSTTLTVAAAPI